MPMKRDSDRKETTSNELLCSKHIKRAITELTLGWSRPVRKIDMTSLEEGSARNVRAAARRGILISSPDGEHPVFMYGDEENGTIWFRSNADRILLNEDSSHLFEGLHDLSEITVPADTSHVTDMSAIFYGCASLKTPPDTSKWDTSRVTNMHSMFIGCQSLVAPPDTSGWDTSRVEDMGSMFDGCRSLAIPPDTSRWDMSNVTSTHSMFFGCTSLQTPPDTSGWDTSRVMDMDDMFRGCKSLTTPPDTSNWDTSSVEYMIGMFYGCASLKTPPDTSKWDMSKSVSTSYMFLNCESLTEPPDTSGWDTSRLKKVDSMFRGCRSLERTPDMSAWDAPNLTSLIEAFDGCESLEAVRLPTSIATDKLCMSGIFMDCSRLYSINLSGWQVRNTLDARGALKGCRALRNASLPQVTEGACVKIEELFSGCESLERTDIAKWKSVTSPALDHTFKDCTRLTEADLGGLTITNDGKDHWHISCHGIRRTRPAGLQGAFWGCRSLAKLTPPKVDASSIGLCMAFAYCRRLKSVSLSHLGIDKVNTADRAFEGCTSLESADLSGWNTRELPSIADIFHGCSSLRSVDVSGWQLPSLSMAQYAFDGCESLEEVIGWPKDVPENCDVFGMFKECPYSAIPTRS